MMGGMLLCVLVVFMLFGLVAIFLPQSRSLLKLFCRQLVSRTLHMVWGALGALIFSVYLVYDTQVSHLKDHTLYLYNPYSTTRSKICTVNPIYQILVQAMAHPIHNPLTGWVVWDGMGWKYPGGVHAKTIFRWWWAGTTSMRSLPRSTSLPRSPSTWTSSTSSCTSSGWSSPSLILLHLFR